MFIDLHTNVYDEPGYGEALVETARSLGFDHLCIMGGEERYGLAANAEVRRLADRYPEMLVPFAHIDLAEDRPGTLERLKRAGFRGLLAWAPPHPYDDDSFYPLYEAAEALELPVMFYTGFLPRTPLDKALRVRCANMRPVCLDTVARCFTGLHLIGVGLGSPWCEEALETMRRNPNVFFDLSGGMLTRMGPENVGMMLREGGGQLWEEDLEGGLSRQLVFGSGVRHEEIARVESEYRQVLRAAPADARQQEDVMGGTAARILGIEAPER